MEHFRLRKLVESRIHREVYVRFGGECPKTCHSNMEMGVGCLAYAMIRGVASECVIDKLRKISLRQRLKVKTVTSDLSGAMKYIAQKSFPKAQLISDRFHVQQLMSAVIDQMRIELRWKVIEAENVRLKECRRLKSEYKPTLEENGETIRQIMARSKHVMTRHYSKWNEGQAQRAKILFTHFPQLETAYALSMKLTQIYNQQIAPDVARLKLAKWYNEMEAFDPIRFKTVIETFTVHSDTIINYFQNRLTNASAESFNAKIKALRSQFRGIQDVAFFIFRIGKLYG